MDLHPPQIFLDLDCSDIRYTHHASSLFRNILTAEDNFLRGYSDPSKKKGLLRNRTGMGELDFWYATALPGRFCKYYSHGIVKFGTYLRWLRCAKAGWTIDIRLGKYIDLLVKYIFLNDDYNWSLLRQKAWKLLLRLRLRPYQALIFFNESWNIMIRDGKQRSFANFSSDWK